ncbi:cell wall metabolism sensor histidine kinase WalK [Dyadobacter sp. CY323]|uniref:sensor histidine kinase n=1 Tax=Dyadobacter sp. CY323 TaxID=2907302 RepID=UPI001F369997|nr:HAMP domain-containing sensor histidine kinase [Dyadobacter sp. CY323]MCE6990999.1 HAMP domain-containing histidine kinase [Dyadobacter sp. CY323]
MNQRIRTIFWLMTICIVAINAFQGYWLWTTYVLNRQQFSQHVQDALFQVVEGQQIAKADRMFGQTRGKSDRERRVVIRRFDSQTPDETRFFYKSGEDSVAGKMNGNAEDTLARRISGMLIKGWKEGDQVDLTKIKSAYQAELARRLIDAPFSLDTLYILPKKEKNNVMIFDSRRYRAKADGLLRTIPLPVNPVKHLFVQASFETPVPYLLRRMSWLLGGSVMLLIMTTGCFVLMLKIILKQKKLSEIKNDFINNITHELKTPIATITAAVEALMHFGVLNDPAKTQSYLAISQTNLTRLSELVDKVLNLAVEEKREMDLYREPVNLAEMVDNLVSNYRVKAGKPVDFDLNIPSDAMVSVDKIHFSNVLNNLIDNAINYSYEKVTVCFKFREEAEGWQLAVADNGIGIEKMYQNAVFERFFRVPTGNLHAVKGFGLGLAYVRQVVEKHGGKINVISEPGKGSEFILTF